VNRHFQNKLAKPTDYIASIPTKFCTTIKITKCSLWEVQTRAQQT